jgi:hypothetical protein
MSRRKLDPHHARKRAHRYDADTLHAMLLDDYVHNRPLGGPMEKGAVFVVEACAKIAAYRRSTPNDVFEAILAEGAAQTARTTVTLA